MSRHTVVRTALLALILPAAACGQDELKDSEYFPLKVGSTWTYQTSSGKIEQRIVKHEKVGETLCAKIEVVVGGRVVGNEHVTVTDAGVLRYQAMGAKVEPPVMFIKLPPTGDDTWTIDSKIGGQALKGTFKTAAVEEEVKVPAGTFKCVKVTTEDLTAEGKKLPFTYWFARNVGMVKQQLNIGGRDVVLQLEEYKLAE